MILDNAARNINSGWLSVGCKRQSSKKSRSIYRHRPRFRCASLLFIVLLILLSSEGAQENHCHKTNTPSDPSAWLWDERLLRTRHGGHGATEESVIHAKSISDGPSHLTMVCSSHEKKCLMTYSCLTYNDLTRPASVSPTALRSSLRLGKKPTLLSVLARRGPSKSQDRSPSPRWRLSAVGTPRI